MSTEDDLVNQAVVKLVSTAKDIIGDGKITLSNGLQLIISFMRTVEAIPNMSGPQKKSAVIAAVVAILESTGSDKSIVEIMPSLIDTLVGVDKNGLFIVPVESIKSCWSCCTNLCSTCTCPCDSCKCSDQAKDRPESQEMTNKK